MHHHGMHNFLKKKDTNCPTKCCWNDGLECRLHVSSGTSGSMKDPASRLTNHRNLTEALGKLRGSVSGVELDRHVQVKHQLCLLRS